MKKIAALLSRIYNATFSCSLWEKPANNHGGTNANNSVTTNAEESIHTEDLKRKQQKENEQNRKRNHLYRNSCYRQ